MRIWGRPAWVVSVLVVGAATSGCEALKSGGVTRTLVGGTLAISATPAVGGPLVLSAGVGAVGIGKKLALSTSGGYPPYTYSVPVGGGTVSAAGELSAPLVPGTVIAEVMDSRGTTANAPISVTVGVLSAPNDPRYSTMSNLSQTTNADVDAPEAWAINTDCSAVKVAVLDTGIDYNHPDLIANMFTNKGETAGDNVDNDGNGFIDDVRGWNFSGGNNAPMDDNLHGTHVAGTIGAIGNNGIGVTGICWKATIVPLKFLDAEGSGFNSDAIDAIDYATALGVKVINASFGGGGFSQNFKDALDRAAGANVLFVAAAGNEANDNDATPSYPASYASTNVISVAATGATDVLTNFSNFGATSVHIAAPGLTILSTFPTTVTNEMTLLGKTTPYERISGTSMATPHVVGAAALLASFEPALTANDLKTRILDRADAVADLSGKVIGMKRLNLRKTLYVP